MSLIDEALKRAQAADQAAKVPGDERAWTPPPLPDRRPRALNKAQAMIALSILLVALAGAGVMLFFRSRREAARPRSAVSAAVAASSAAAGLPPITSEVTVAPPPRAVGPLSLPQRERASASMALSSAAPTRSSSGAALAVRTPVPAPPNPSEPRESRAHRAGEPRSYAGEMPLAGGGKISLDGIVFSDTTPVAVLNGRVLPPGGYVEGFTIVRILPDRVELEAEGKTVSLTLR